MAVEVTRRTEAQDVVRGRVVPRGPVGSPAAIRAHQTGGQGSVISEAELRAGHGLGIARADPFQDTVRPRELPGRECTGPQRGTHVDREADFRANGGE